jgi:predicted DNA-binding protein YlxM (UPF0122 family)
MAKQEMNHLPLDVPPPPPPPPVVWTGGKPSGVRLSRDQRELVKSLFLADCSFSEIAKQTGHGRKTIAAVIAADPELVNQLKEQRLARLLVEDAMLHDDRVEVMDAKRESGKLSVADLNSAIMINGIAMKDAGGAAPRRVILEADPSLAAAAALFAGTPMKATGPVVEAEVVEEAQIFETNDQA